MSAAEIVRVDDVRGWSLMLLQGEDRPRVGHHEAAERLGYARADMLLDLADRVFGPAWKLSAQYREFRRGQRGPLTKDFLFSRRELIRLSMRSDAPNADLIQEEFADVIEAWMDGNLAPRRDASVADAVRMLGARIADNTLAEKKIKAGLHKVARRWGSTVLKPIGRLRKEFGTPGYRSIPLVALDLALETLESWADDEPPPPPPPPDGPQLTLFKGGKAA